MPRDQRGVAVRPVFVSQHNACAILGFKTPRAFLEWLTSSGCRVVERGKDRLVHLDEAEATLLRSLNTTAQPVAGAAEQPGDVSAVLARIGRRVGGSR